jgi:transposase-like protein
MTTLVPLPAVPLELEPTLEQLAADIRREHELCVFHALSALEHAIRAGEALLRAKEHVPKGRWERWLDENVPDVVAQSRPYMRVAAYRDAIPVEITTLTEGLHSLKGLPAFDGTGPRRHPPEVRERALELIGEGLSQRVVASILDINRKCVGRWVGSNARRSEGNYRKGRPTRTERKERERVVAQRKRAIGPAALANCFRRVWETRQQDEPHALIASLYNLANTAVDWAEQLEARNRA